MWDLHSNSKAWQGCCPQTHGKTGSPPLESALPPPYPYSPFVHGAEGKHSQPLWVCPAALEHHFPLHDESLVRQGTKGPLSKKLLTWTSMHPHEVFFLFSSLGEQSSLPASSIRTYWTSQKRSMGLKNEKKMRERERKPSFLLIQVSRLDLGFSHSPSQNEDRTSATSAARGAENAARYRRWNNSNNNGRIY